MKPSGGDVLMQALLDAGVDTVFGYPGGAIMPSYDALYAVRDRLRHVLVRHEQGAIHAAQGYARAAGTVGVCMATSGPGATNLITGLTDALMDSTPIVCLTGQVASHLLGTDAFQEADTIGLTLAATKWSYQVSTVEEIPAVIRLALRVARSGRPGPVLIDLPRDVQAGVASQPAAAPGIDHPHYQSWAPFPPNAGPEALAQAAALINTARRPLLLVGQGVSLSRAEAQVRQLAETAGLPVAATLHGLSAVPCDHPLYVGMVGMHGNYGANLLTNEADVIVAVGVRFDDRVTGKVDTYARKAAIVHIEIDPTELDRHVPATVGLVGDARRVLDALLPSIEPASHPQWLARFRECDRQEQAEVVGAELEPGSGALRMGEVVRKLSVASDGAALIVSDVGQHQMMAARYYGFSQPLSHITSGGAGTMGFALPAAIGAALSAPHRQVVAIIGDGGFQMTLQELGTLAQERLPVKIVILNNGYLGMVRQWQELYFNEHYSCVRIDQPDFVTLCAAYRIPARRVERREDLDEAVGELLAADGPYLLDVAVAPMGNVFPMVPAGASVSDVRLR